MRTTLYLESKLLRDAKKQAAAEGRTFTDFTAEAIRESLLRRRKSRLRRAVVLPTFAGDGLIQGVDLDNNAALLDIMEA